ncbi:WEB family [Dillenia turbinata]|uniref:WEB family n=1 Tax=Dillenia turbinata TaxID=194707 RepID=A0AAN8VVG4_9MAGN
MTRMDLSRSALSEAPNTKTSPATPKVSRLSRGVTKTEPDSPASLQKSRLSIDRSSPRSVNSKPTPPSAVERRTPRLSTPSNATTTPEKPQLRVSKSSELQAQLNLAQGELKKANEQLVLAEKEKAKALEELKEAQRFAEEANEKLGEALVAQKRAEESSEIEKFRAVELEQAGIEAAKKKEEEWHKELEDVRSQHALDVAALLSTTQELQKLRQEVAMILDAKNQALSHADDATKIAEIHAEKVEGLSAELAQVKALLDSKHELEVDENNKMVAKLNSEIELLKEELEKAKYLAKKLAEKEASIEQLNVDLEAAKMAESYARNLVEEWKMRVEELEKQVEEANRLERSASESLESVMRQMEGNNDLLHDAESEIASLKENIGLLEISSGRQKVDLDESDRRAETAKKEAAEMANEVESLKSELETAKEEKAQALNNEKLAASSVQSLLEEKNKLISDLESSRNEEEKSKKAMESLASALHEVSAEARETKEKLLMSQSEYETYETQLEDIKLVLKATNEKYESMLGEAKSEIDILTNAIEQSSLVFKKTRDEWEQRERELVSSVKQAEQEASLMEMELNRVSSLLKAAEEKVSTAEEEEARAQEDLKDAESEVNYLKEVLGEAKAESMKLKESLLDKETELQGIIQENEDLRAREAASIKKVEELSKMLEEALAKKEVEENGELTDSEKDYDMLPKVVEFSEENGDRQEERPKIEASPLQCEEHQKEMPHEDNNDVVKDKEVEKVTTKIENRNGKPKEIESKEKEEEDPVEADFKMWDTCKIEDKEFSPEREAGQESAEEEVESKADGGDSFDQINGLSSAEKTDNGETSPSKDQQQQKKKKAFIRKFGSLLKKKGASNQK